MKKGMYGHLWVYQHDINGPNVMPPCQLTMHVELAKVEYETIDNEESMGAFCPCLTRSYP